VASGKRKRASKSDKRRVTRKFSVAEARRVESPESRAAVREIVKLLDRLDALLSTPEAQAQIDEWAGRALSQTATPEQRRKAQRQLARLRTVVVPTGPTAPRSRTKAESDRLRKRRWTVDERKAALRQTNFPGRHEYRRKRDKIGRDKLPDDYTIVTQLVGGGKRHRRGDPPRLWSDALDAARP
jgi:hypothetical protein